MVWINNGTVELDQISRYRTILGVCISLAILTTTIVALRAYTRARILNVLGIDDYVVFFSYVSCSGADALRFMLTKMALIDLCYNI